MLRTTDSSFSFTELKKFLESQRREPQIEKRSESSKNLKSLSTSPVEKRSLSIPHWRTEKQTQFEIQKVIASHMIENVEFKPHKSIPLNTVILTLNDLWEDALFDTL
eukprot:gene11628-4870_t